MTITAAGHRDQHPSDDGLLPMIVNETRRPFNAITSMPAATLDHVLRRSCWRRHHQANARASHYRRRDHQPN